MINYSRFYNFSHVLLRSIWLCGGALPDFVKILLTHVKPLVEEVALLSGCRILGRSLLVNAQSAEKGCKAGFMDPKKSMKQRKIKVLIRESLRSEDRGRILIGINFSQD